MLGCIQPMSSPMMKRMLGFFVCCSAGAGDGSGSAAWVGHPAPMSAAVDASSEKPLGINFRFIVWVFLFGSIEGFKKIANALAKLVVMCGSFLLGDFARVHRPLRPGRSSAQAPF